MAKSSILFLCTGNSCRSQMAEGWLRHFHGDRYDVYSAGIEAHGKNPSAVKVMQEVGIDISQQESQTLDELPLQNIDYVVSVCDHANENCPIFPATIKRIHQGFEDPPKLAQVFEDEEQKLDCYRKVRDDIKSFAQSVDDYL